MPLPMIKDDYDYLFYVVQKNSEMIIMEGNPKDPYIENHYSVYKIKIKQCLALSLNKEEMNKLFLMDENKTIYMLGR